MSFSKIDLEFSQLRLNCVLLIPLGIRLGVMSWTQKAKCYVLALFAYVNEQSGIFLKIIGQKTASSQGIRPPVRCD